MDFFSSYFWKSVSRLDFIKLKLFLLISAILETCVFDDEFFVTTNQTVKKLLSEKKPLFEFFLSISENLLQQQQQQERSPQHLDNIDEIQKLRIDTEVSWVEVEVSALKRLDDLKSTLHRWTDYTENMRDVMTWLRACEGKIKQPHHQLDFLGLQVSLKELQVRWKHFLFHFLSSSITTLFYKLKCRNDFSERFFL